MQYLLDTHTILWFLEDSHQLPGKIREKIEAYNSDCYVSIASIWEIAIKMKLGKLALKFKFTKFANYLSDSSIDIIPISIEHIFQLLDLPMHHRDPFDRLIIAQAITENLTLISKDENFRNYVAKVLWEN